MSQKPESRLAKYIFSKVRKDVYFEKINNQFRAGIPDYYVEGPGNILWVEVKWIEKPWTKNLEPSKICRTASWTKQRHWLERAHKNGKQTCVIVGTGSGQSTKGYILEYPYGYDMVDIQSVNEITKWIENKVL